MFKAKLKENAKGPYKNIKFITLETYNTEVVEVSERESKAYSVGDPERKKTHIHIHNSWWHVIADGFFSVITTEDWDAISSNYDLV